MEGMAHEGWMILSDPPFTYTSQICHVLTLNETELLIVVDQNYSLNEIWTYNICNDNYTKLIAEESIKENMVKEHIQFYTASLHDNKSFLYLFGESGDIIKVNLKTKQFEKSKISYHNGSISSSLFINEQFHIFGGWNIKDR
eukprot:491340_1